MKRALVLHRRPFRNTSLLVEFFAENDGRFPAVVRGGAKGKSAALLQPFIPLRITWRGKGEVKTVSGFEPDDYQLSPLTGTALYCGLYLNELLMRLVPRGEGHDKLLASYIRTLSELPASGQVDWVLRQFELQLLQEVGYELVVDQTIDGEPVEVNKSYRYRHGVGIEETRKEADAVSGKALIALQKKTCEDGQLRREARILLRGIIDYHLDYKPLKSRELLR